jgi:N-acetylmuramoyl-L-alanine amidase
MACFISAGHSLKDSGAVANGMQENTEAIAFRDIVLKLCRDRGLKVISDNDNESLKEYLDRIQSGDGSVVLEFHFDASTGVATGSTCLVGTDADRLDKAFAKDLVDATSDILKIKNRGVKSEAESHRGRLGLMREQGIVSLLEICFIDNVEDMKAYKANTYTLAAAIVSIIEKYEKMIQ